MSSHVKLERHDEAEIQELAAKLLAKLQAPVRPPVTTQVSQSMNIMSFLNSTNKPKSDGTSTSSANSAPLYEPRQGDEESLRGRFGWTTVGKAHIPYLFRTGEKYCSVRMVELKILHKYLTFLHQDIYTCTCVRSYYITEAEARLLNEINFKHCDYQFGREQFTQRDLIVRLNDALEFFKFLDACYSKLLNDDANPGDKFGFIRINKESVVPFTYYKNTQYVPLFYFEGETENLKSKAENLDGWNLSYLKFCCKVQGIRNELFSADSCQVISLKDIKTYFPPGTLFEVYWPTKVVDLQILMEGDKQIHFGQWIRQPTNAPPPTVPMQPPPIPKPAAQAKATNNNQQLQPSYPNYSIATPTQNNMYPPLVPRPASSTRAALPPISVARRRLYSLPPPPPPLVRANQQPATYNNPQNSTGSSLMLDPIFGYQRPNPHLYIRKYGTPFVPVGTIVNGEVVYEGVPSHYGDPPEVLDLNGAHKLPEMPTSMPINRNTATPRPVPGTIDEELPEIDSYAGGRSKLVTIPEFPNTGNHIPFKIQKALIDNRLIPCINMKPYLYNELLVTIPDIAEHLFNNVPIPVMQQVIDVLSMEIYKGNSSQMRVLYENGKCQSLNQFLPLVSVRFLLEYMPQLKYMLNEMTSKSDQAS